MDDKQTASDHPTHGWGRRVLRILRIPAVKLRNAFRKGPLRLRKHRSGFYTLPTYGTTESSEDMCGDECLVSSLTEGEQGNDRTSDTVAASDDRPKRKLRKRVKKTLRRCVEHYGDGALMSGGPLSTAYIARDIQQRITLNHEYVEMHDTYIPAVFY